jgi:hypothetical protein
VNIYSAGIVTPDRRIGHRFDKRIWRRFYLNFLYHIEQKSIDPAPVFLVFVTAFKYQRLIISQGRVRPTLQKSFRTRTNLFMRIVWKRKNHRNLSTRRSMLKKGRIFFQLVYNLFCVVKRGFVEPCENVFLSSKLPCLGWRSPDFLQGFFAKNASQTYSF